MSNDNLPTPALVRNELQLADPSKIVAKPGETPDLDQQADACVDALIRLNPLDHVQRSEGHLAAETMGIELQKEALRQSEILKQPMRTLASRGEDGGDVGKSMIDLKMKVEELDPGKFDFEPGWFARTVGRLPGVGSPLKRYFSRFESGQTAIAAIIRSLEVGRSQLERDNITLADDQKRMRELTVKLERAVKLGQLIDAKLETRLSREFKPEDEQHKFLSEEVLFPLRQRIIDLQQQLAVNQQGVVATELIIRNNRELIRGVNRSLNVTVTALQVAATVAMALENQRITLDKIQAVSKTTSDLIAGTAARLKTQGVEIQKQASGAMLDLNALRSAFTDLNQALEDVSQFRRAALPQMATVMLEMDKMAGAAQETIARLDRGNRSRPELQIEVDAQTLKKT